MVPTSTITKQRKHLEEVLLRSLASFQVEHGEAASRVEDALRQYVLELVREGEWLPPQEKEEAAAMLAQAEVVIDKEKTLIPLDGPEEW